MSKKLYQRAHKLWGKDQFIYLMEECAELQQAASKFYRDKGNLEDLAEEIADVEIMIAQMKVIFEDENLNRLIDEQKSVKLRRLGKRVKRGEIIDSIKEVR